MASKYAFPISLPPNSYKYNKLGFSPRVPNLWNIVTFLSSDETGLYRSDGTSKLKPSTCV